MSFVTFAELPGKDTTAALVPSAEVYVDLYSTYTLNTLERPTASIDALGSTSFIDMNLNQLAYAQDYHEITVTVPCFHLHIAHTLPHICRTRDDYNARTQ